MSSSFTLTPSCRKCGSQYAGIRSNELGLSIEYTTQMTCALRISDSRCDRSWGPAIDGTLDVVERVVRVQEGTSRVDNICSDIFRGDLWWNGNLRNDVLNLGEWVSDGGCTGIKAQHT